MRNGTVRDAKREMDKADTVIGAALLVVGLMLLSIASPLCSCGKSRSHAGMTQAISAKMSQQHEPDSSSFNGTSPAPSLDNLTAILNSELARLGIDPARAIAKAPAGDAGRVTDLTYDTGTHTLSWTYANLADYDSSGEVGVPDITPIARNYLAKTNDGIGNDAFEAWIDGSGDGEVGVPDITPIAQNYLARVDGYRVYRKAPGETELRLQTSRPAHRPGS